jgi:hypothetical protein
MANSIPFDVSECQQIQQLVRMSSAVMGQVFT